MYLLVWIEDNEVKFWKYKTIEDMMQAASGKEVVAHTYILSSIDIANRGVEAPAPELVTL